MSEKIEGCEAERSRDDHPLDPSRYPELAPSDE